MNTLDANCNTAIGSNSLYYNTIGDYNTAVGAGSLCNNTIGSLNTAIGASALEGDVTQYTVGDENVAIGAQSLFNNSGDYNTAVGYLSLLNNTTGSQNVALGNNAGPSSSYPGLSNSIAIGYNANVSASNTIQMGNSSIKQMNTYGTIGIGNYANDTLASGITGSIYYNTTNSVLKVSNGTSWSTIGTASGTGTTGPAGPGGPGVV